MGHDRDQIAKTKRRLRDLRRLEIRFRGVPETAHLVWDEYFTVEPGDPARYPIATLSVLDRESRKRIFGEYLSDVFCASIGGNAGESPGRSSELLESLGLPRRASEEEVRSHFRARAKELHPDLGGDADAMAELLRLYSGAQRSG